MLSKNGTKLVTKVRTLNPVLLKTNPLIEMNLSHVKVACFRRWRFKWASLENDGSLYRQFNQFTSFSPASPTQHHSVSFHAYLGVVALDAGANIVITGRVVDSALVVGPLMHGFSWHKREYSHSIWLAGIRKGHIIWMWLPCYQL
jgi:hypothetical protein